MRQKYWTRISRVLLVFAVVALFSVIPKIAAACTLVYNQQSCSNTYGVGQVEFNSGGVNQCPLKGAGGTYCANISVGDLTDGNPSSGNLYQAQTGSGFVTNRDPFIAFSVGGVSTDLGYLSSISTKDLTANFTVETYLAHGYTVEVAAPPPTDDAPGHHILAVPSSPTTSSVGSEQFGINLVANTTPPSLGAAPYCSPSSSFCPSGAGAMANAITSNYNQTNKFYYPGSGSNYTDTLVNSTTSTGAVSYTVSFIYNISTTTPAGLYSYNGMFVASSTY